MTTTLVLSYTYRNHLDEVKHYREQFLSMHDFRNYLRWEPERAMLIRYGKVDEERIRNSRTSNVKICITRASYPEVTFDDVFQLANYLENNPEVARALQYKRKSE